MFVMEWWSYLAGSFAFACVACSLVCAGFDVRAETDLTSEEKGALETENESPTCDSELACDRVMRLICTCRHRHKSCSYDGI